MNDCFFTVPSKPKKTQSVSPLSHLLLKLGVTGVQITQSQSPILQEDDTPLLSAFKCLNIFVEWCTYCSNPEKFASLLKVAICLSACPPKL